MAKKETKPEANKKSKKDAKNKKSFFKDFKTELKKVVWPTPKQLLNSTIAVITIVLVIGIIVFALDLGFNGLHHGVTKLQSNIQKNENTVEDSTENSNTVSEETNSTDNASSEESNVE